MTESRSVVDDERDELVAEIRAAKKSFLETLTRNEDGSITVQRTGRLLSGIGDWGIPSTLFIPDEPPQGVKRDDRAYIEQIVKEMDYEPDDQVTYSITIAPKRSES